MAYHTFAPITTDGLILYLDAVNPKSYPGSGTDWFDLTKNHNDGTLINNPTFINDYIYFNGSAQSINFGDSDLFTPTSLTLDLWARPNNFGTGQTLVDKYQQATGHEYIFGIYNGDLYGWVFDNTIGSNYRGRIVRNISNYIHPNTWNNFVFTWDGGITTSSCKIYVNSIRLDDDDFVSGGFTGILNTPTPLQLGGSNDGLGGPYWGDISSFKFYNRPLSQQEITNNYNATKMRYL